MQFLDFHTHQLSNVKESIDIINIRQGYSLPFSYDLFGYGIHPWDTKEQQKLKLPDEMINSENWVYIGETGLDKLKGAELNSQIEIFKQHIHASEKWRKPLLIHCVRCFNELIQLHNEYAPQQKWIVHGFIGSPELAKQLTEAGFLLSFGVGIINKESKAAHSLRTIPKESFLLETDDASIPIQEVYRAASEVIQITMQNLKKVVSDNFKRLTFIEI